MRNGIILAIGELNIKSSEIWKATNAPQEILDLNLFVMVHNLAGNVNDRAELYPSRHLSIKRGLILVLTKNSQAEPNENSFNGLESQENAVT